MRSMVTVWSRSNSPKLPNNAPSATKIAVKPSTNSRAPAMTRRGRGPLESDPDRPAT